MGHPSSWTEWKYPDWMDVNFRSSRWWIEQKKKDDGAEGLWRIHDGLYDLSSWIDKHPGGKKWISITKGLDITEAFEASHLNPDVEKLLPKFFVRNANTPRNSPYTFNPDGFFRTLKKRIWNTIKDKKRGPKLRSIIFLDSLVISTLLTAVFAARYYSIFLGITSGILLSCATIVSHNFFHQRDNWRMYYFQLSLLSVTDWRISHALSHHAYTNTHQDLEVMMLEPFFQWLPREDKNWIVRYFSWVYSPFIYVSIFYAQGLNRLLRDGVEWEDSICLVIPSVIYLFSGSSLLHCLEMWFLILTSGSLFFGFVGINAAHHHPDIFHEGDKPRKDHDWALNQMDAVRDKIEVAFQFPWAHITFGDHTLHHIFPTIDQDILPELYPILEKTCLEFDFELRFTTIWDLVKGQYLQLSRNKPCLISPEEKFSLIKK
ncbi:cytochrome b5-related protein-like [Lycorma delicatula]|uniref:cytochrome b5-related protein-like n=1 Tax=Lycorma delicatula TaxID=130591 RepID=UPI003F519FA5